MREALHLRAIRLGGKPATGIFLWMCLCGESRSSEYRGACEASRLVCPAEDTAWIYATFNRTSRVLALRNHGRSRRRRYPGMDARLSRICCAHCRASSTRPCDCRNNA